MNAAYAALASLAIFAAAIAPSSAYASPASASIKSAAEAIFKRFGPGVAGKTAAEVTEQTGKAVAKYGDDALPLLRETGHRGFTALDEGGAKAPDVIKLYKRKGSEAVWIISEPRKLAIFVKHGDSAAEALLKHPGIAEALIERHGSSAAGALNRVGRDKAQLLGMAERDGVFSATSRSPELLGVVERYGDPAMEFVWQHKGALTVTAALGAFLIDPKPFLDGIQDITKVVAESAVRPIAEAPGKFAVEAAKRTDWTAVGVSTVVVLGILGGGWLWSRRRAVKGAGQRAKTPQS